MNDEQYIHCTRFYQPLGNIFTENLVSFEKDSEMEWERLIGNREKKYKS